MSFLPKATITHSIRNREHLVQATELAQTNHRISAAIRFLRDNLSLESSPESIAIKVGLSTSRLCSLFKETTGLSLGKYTKLLRLETARDLFETGFPAVQEVMCKVGIHDPSHFNRDFKNAYGVTPAKYRDRRSEPSLNLGIVSE